MYEQIPNLLGYDNDIVVLDTEYNIYSWLDQNGLKINVMLDNDDKPDGREYYSKFHYISENELNRIISKNRDSFLNEEDVDLSYDWKVGDICYFEYKVAYVAEMHDDRVTMCSEGYGGTNGYSLNDRCVKITPNSLRCSYNVDFYYTWMNDQSEKLEEGYVLNFHDIHNILVDLWLELLSKKGDTIDLNSFGQSIIDCINEKDYSLQYNGINMFRERGVVEAANPLNIEDVDEII